VVRECGGEAVVKYDVKEDKLVIWKVDRKQMLPKDLYFKWDDGNKSEAETVTEHDAGAKSAVKPVDGVETKVEGKSVISGLRATKGKEAAKAIGGGEQILSDDLFPCLTPAKDTHSGPQDKGGEHLAADLEETLLNSSSTR